MYSRGLSRILLEIVFHRLINFEHGLLTFQGMVAE